MRKEIERYMAARPCASCKGRRLRREALAVTVGGLNIMDMTDRSINGALEWIDSISGEGPSSNGTKPEDQLTERDKTIASQILKEIDARLRFLLNIGLDYLTLSRTASTLSGGEAQRIRLATQIGSGLMGVLYVCDEPSIGLHPADDYRLIHTLKRLRDLGNTVIIVEHDEAIMRAADHIVDIGPGAGEHGGHIVATGTVQDIIDTPESITGLYLGGFRTIPVPETRREGNGKFLTIRGARQNNLKDIDVKIPLGVLVCVTGVSGSGKSTLMYEVLYKQLAKTFYRAKDRPGDFDKIEASRTSITWSTSTSPPSAGLRAPILPPTPGHSPQFGSCLPPFQRPGLAGTSPAGSPSTSRADAVRLAPVMGTSTSRCSSYPT